MDHSRIAELLRPFLAAPMADFQLAAISTYIDILLRWNARINLTAVRHPEEIVTRHFGESFFAARHLLPDARVEAGLRPAEPGSPAGTRVLDIGSGAGFPGIPLSIWAPHTKLILIESNQKKATFLRQVARSITLTNIDVFHGRAQDFQQPADIVTLRAVERFATILPTAADLVAPAGRLALLIGHSQVDPARSLAQQFNWQPPLPIPRSASRVLLVGTSLK